MTSRFTLFAFGVVLMAPGLVEAFALDQTNWFIGIDSRTTIPTGTYAGLANPNFGRLTFLYGHQYDGIDDGALTAASSHYHGKSNFSYTGPAGSPTIVNRPPFNFLPEDGTRIALAPGSGATASLLTTQPGATGTKWANPVIRSTSWLTRPGAMAWETVLHGSSGGRYAGSLGLAELALEVVSISPGLRIHGEDLSLVADAAGERLALGTGDFAGFLPTFAVDGSTAFGTTFFADLKIVDLRTSGALPESGVFQMRYEAVPEPATLAVLAGLGVLAARRRRRV